ncbi:hypothetical protein MRX96_002237 [Rhipicephalus microplus]
MLRDQPVIAVQAAEHFPREALIALSKNLSEGNELLPTPDIAALAMVGGYLARAIEHHYGHLSANSRSSDAMAAPNGDPDANPLIRQKQHHKRAFDFDYEALKYDEDNRSLKVLAIDLYRKGIEELQKGIAIDFSQAKGPS